MIMFLVVNLIEDSYMNELDKVKISYSRGELESLRTQLESFISCNKDKILQFKAQEENTWDRPLDMATAIKLFLLKVRTIDTEAEMRDQMKAITMELKVACEDETEQNHRWFDWIRRNGVSWRGYRVLAIIYVFDQNQDHMLSRFCDR